MRRWLPLVILAAAQFVMVLDSSVMNVSISQIVADLDTTVTGVQGAITMYTLVMAAFMLVGAKLGDIWGRDRRRLPPLPARQRDHDLGPTGEDERGGRVAGDGSEPRRLAGHRAHRLRAPRRPSLGFQPTHRREPRALRACRQKIAAGTEDGIEIITTEQAHALALDAGLTPAEADAVTADYARRRSSRR